MIKRLVLVESVCLTALVISSCSDNSTQSGVELGLAGTDVAPTAADNFDVEGSPYNRSASCDLVFAGTKYVDHILHKVLAKCDSVNKYYAYHGKPHSTATLIQALDNWCTSQHGSTTTIIDADEQQCSSGSGAYNVVTVGYVNKYGDLLAVYNASGGGQTKSAWGKNHYCNNGRTEGRTYSGLSAASCSSTTTTTTTTTTSSSAESCYGDYVRKYPDLLAVYNSSGGGQSIEAWGNSHYINHGQTEGRSACSTTSTSTTTTTTCSWPSGVYNYLCKHNECTKFSNRTRRWPSTRIQVSGATRSEWREGAMVANCKF